MSGPVQRGLFGDDRPLRERRPKDQQLALFDAHIDPGRFAGPAERVALTLAHEEPRSEAEVEEDRMRAAAAATASFLDNQTIDEDVERMF